MRKHMILRTLTFTEGCPMKPASIAFALILATGVAASARADNVPCPANSAQSVLSVDQAIGKAEVLGYSVKEAKRSQGCWKIEGFDRNGAEIEIRFDSVSGEVVKPHDWRAPSSR